MRKDKFKFVMLVLVFILIMEAIIIRLVTL